MRFYSVTWQEGNFNRTACMLAFNSKAARAAYPATSGQRVEPISCKRKDQLQREGRLVFLKLWDKSSPGKFVQA